MSWTCPTCGIVVPKVSGPVRCGRCSVPSPPAQPHEPGKFLLLSDTGRLDYILDRDDRGWAGYHREAVVEIVPDGQRHRLRATLKGEHPWSLRIFERLYDQAPDVGTLRDERLHIVYGHGTYPYVTLSGV